MIVLHTGTYDCCCVAVVLPSHTIDMSSSGIAHTLLNNVNVVDVIGDFVDSMDCKTRIAIFQKKIRGC